MLFVGLGCATRGDGLDVAASSPTRGIVVIPASGKLLFPGAGRGAGRKENEAGARRCLSASGGTVVLDLCSRSGDGNVSHFTDEETEASRSDCLQVLLTGGGALPWPCSASSSPSPQLSHGGRLAGDAIRFASERASLGLIGKEAACNAGETRPRSLGQGRSPGEGNGYPLNQDNSQVFTLKGGLPSYSFQS